MTKREVVPAADEDYADGTMQTMRDLEDFARIHIRLDGLHEQVVDGTFKIGLKFSQASGGSSKINVYKSTDADGSNSYLTDEKAAMAQISGKDAQSLGEVTSGDPLMLPTDFWDELQRARMPPNTCSLRAPVKAKGSSF